MSLQLDALVIFHLEVICNAKHLRHCIYRKELSFNWQKAFLNRYSNEFVTKALHQQLCILRCIAHVSHQEQHVSRPYQRITYSIYSGLQSFPFRDNVSNDLAI